MNNTLIAVKETRSVIPILIDEKSLLVIDGHHRREAMMQLGFKRIPVYAVDYQDSSITVDVWYRKVELNPVSRLFLNSLKSEGKICFSISEFKICSESVYSAYWKLQWLEQKLKLFGSAMERNPSEGFSPPHLDKDVILDIAKKGLRLPPKTSRHTYDFIIPKERVKLQ
ncbi:ParB N-terminal domain-containing protein [Metallosphaera tengchongensis]|nr:ParB N-terminal domain-containing protein [Metallosphaera tengchongensis]